MLLILILSITAAGLLVWMVAYPLGKQEGYRDGWIDASRSHDQVDHLKGHNGGQELYR